MCRLVLETAIGPVLPLSDGKDREARWDSAAATGGVKQDPPCGRAAGHGQPTSEWRSAAEPNVQPGWLVQPLPRRGEWKGLRHRPHRAAECLKQTSTGAMDGCTCAFGCLSLSLSSMGDQAAQIRLGAAISASAMLRIHGDRDSLLAALAAHWADQQLQIPSMLKPVVRPIRRRLRPLR